MFARQIVSSDTLQRAFFEIKVDTRLENRAFAEREALWCVRLTLCNEDDQNMKEMYEHQKKSVGGGDEQASLPSLGNILYNMGEYEKAKQYYTHVLDELSGDDRNVAVCHYGLGEVSGERGEYDVALDHLNEAVKLYKKSQQAHDTLDIAQCYCWIGVVHSYKEEYETALSYLSKDLAIKQAKLPAGHVRALVMCKKVLPPTHSSIFPDRALNCYNQSLQMERKSLPPDHPNVATTYYSIDRVYEEKNDLTTALDYFEQCLVVRKKSLPPPHPYIQSVGDAIRR
ncbi:unnamed protein product, partial [Didymodactylos carnosus]